MRAILEAAHGVNLDLDRWIAAAVENLAAVDVDDRGHLRCSPGRVAVACIAGVVSHVPGGAGVSLEYVPVLGA